MRVWILIFVCSSLTGFAQERETPQPQIGNSLEPVDRRDLELLKKDYEILLKNYGQRVDAQIRDLQTFKNMMLTLGFGTLLALGISTFGLFRWSDKKIKKKVRRIVNRDPELLGRLIDQADKDRRIREKLKILLVGKGGMEAWGIVKQLGFRELEAAVFPAGAELDENAFREFQENQYDLIVFDRLAGKEIDAYIEHSAKGVFVGFSPDRVIVQRNDRINFANSPMTLYTRILEAARYQELKKKSHQGL